MQLVLSEDQELIATTARDFLAASSPVSRFRALRDAGDPLGFSPALLREMAGLGWLGIPFDEKEGGAGLGLAELVLIAEALGRKLAPEPIVGGLAMGGVALARGAGPALRGGWLPGVIEGSKVVALAHQEPGSRYDLLHVATRAERAGQGHSLTGAKIPGPRRRRRGGRDRAGAHERCGRGSRGHHALPRSEQGARGLTVERQLRVDHRNAAMRPPRGRRVAMRHRSSATSARAPRCSRP